MSLSFLNPLEGLGPCPVLAGPCSAETREQTLNTARLLNGIGIKVFRAGIWKPRTHPGGFEGVGEEALEWLAEVRAETGMKVATEVATPEHVEAALRSGIDMLWIGARTTANPFAVQELADAISRIDPDIPVLVKNPVSPDLELWIGAIERLNKAGIRRLGAIHRGFSTYGESEYRNAPVWQIPTDLKVRFPELTLLHDPSHTGGDRELIENLSRRALRLGFDGLIIETHHDPDHAWSDARQQITPTRLQELIGRLPAKGRPLPSPEANDQLKEYRREIDSIDARLLELLGQRMELSRAIGDYKRERGISVVQPERFGSLLEERVARGAAEGLPDKFVREIMEVIHHESVDQQLLSSSESVSSGLRMVNNS